MAVLIRKLTRKEIGTRALLLWLSDIHIPIHNERVLRLIVEVAEKLGVTHVVAGGDILDLHCLSEHPKDPERMLEAGSLLEEVEPGRWILDWFATRPTYLIQGNHEGRLDRFIAKHAPALWGASAGSLQTLCNIPRSIEVLPWEDGMSELRLGNLVFVHGDGEFKRGSGGKFPAHKLLEMNPDQSTMCGHLHRKAFACRTAYDEDGILRTRAAYVMPHLSDEKHHSYAGKVKGWQTGFGLIPVWWEGDRPRWDVTQVEVMFDHKNRPYFSLWGEVYRG